MNILYIYNSLYLAPKYARIVLRSQFSSSHALRKLFASRNWQCPKTKYPSIFFAQNGGYSVIIILQVIFPTRVVLKIGEFDLRGSGLGGGGGYKCQLSVKIVAICQLSVKFKAICQLPVNWLLIIN